MLFNRIDIEFLRCGVCDTFFDGTNGFVRNTYKVLDGTVSIPSVVEL